MDTGTRAITAAVIRVIHKNHMIDKIQDRSAGKTYSITGTLSPTAIDIYDHTRGCHVNGSIHGHDISLHDHKTTKRLTLTLSGGSFHGYDSGSSKGFSGSVTDSSVSIYDNEDGKHHLYS
ncbi:MAG: hypothetical protein WC101_04505 [Candidatus Gracilibacteria bacterium]